MERYKKVPKRPMRQYEEPGMRNRNMKDRKDTKSHHGQLLKGVLEDIETTPLASNSSVTSSFVQSITDSEELDYALEERNIQSASVKKQSHPQGLVRSKTTLGTTNRVKKHIDIKNDERFMVADVVLEKPKLPTALFWTRGDGSFITGLKLTKFR